MGQCCSVFMHSHISKRVLCKSLCVKGKFESLNNKNVAPPVNRQCRVVKVCLSMQWPTYAPKKVLIKRLIVLLPPPPSPRFSVSLFFSMLPSLNQALLGSLYNPDLTVPDRPANPTFLTSWTSQKCETSNTYWVTHSSSREVKTWRVRSLGMETPLHLNQSAGGKKAGHKKGKTRSQCIFNKPNIQNWKRLEY